MVSISLHSCNIQHFKFFIFSIQNSNKLVAYKWRSEKNGVKSWSTSLISIGISLPFAYFEQLSYSSNFIKDSCGHWDIVRFRWLPTINLKCIHDRFINDNPFLNSFKSKTSGKWSLGKHNRIKQQTSFTTSSMVPAFHLSSSGFISMLNSSNWSRLDMTFWGMIVFQWLFILMH